jgi:hypothetical protein
MRSTCKKKLIVYKERNSAVVPLPSKLLAKLLLKRENGKLRD